MIQAYTLQNFLDFTLAELESITGTAARQWSTYFTGSTITESLLNNLAPCFGISAPTLLYWIQIRRARTVAKRQEDTKKVEAVTE